LFDKGKLSHFRRIWVIPDGPKATVGFELFHFPLFSMPDMNSLTDETGIDAEIGVSSDARELMGMMKSREEVGVNQLPPAIPFVVTVGN
jgi:hypothetical protein